MTHVHVHVLVLVLGSCEREHPAEVPRIACDTDRDCPILPPGSRCAYTCGPTICQLVAVIDHADGGPCFGTHHDGASAFESQDQVRAFGVCDASAGLYCERASQRCATVKRRGASCRADAECGVDGRCDDDARTCASAGAAGASCKTERCGVGLYCDANARCAAHRALGAACDFGDECASFTCDRSHCIAAPAPISCPIAI